MPLYQFNKPARPSLVEELYRAGLFPGDAALIARPARVFLAPDGTTAWVEATPEEFDAVASVVAAHDAVAYDAATAVLTAQDGSDLAAFRQVYRALEDRADALRTDASTMPPTLTAAQVRARLISIENNVADLADVVAALSRYVGKRMG